MNWLPESSLDSVLNDAMTKLDTLAKIKALRRLLTCIFDDTSIIFVLNPIAYTVGFHLKGEVLLNPRCKPDMVTMRVDEVVDRVRKRQTKQLITEIQLSLLFSP